MKYFLILSSVFMTVNAFAAETCDLNISVNKITGAKESKIIFEDTFTSAYSKGKEFNSDILEAKLLNKCIKAGAENCTVKNLEFEYDNTFGIRTWKSSATVEGKILIGGIQLSESEYAKKRQKAICHKLDSCINDALNDNDSSTTFMEKLYLIKDKTNCNEGENFIFDN